MVGHAGARLLADLAEATGLTGQFSQALAGLRRRDRGHDPGRVAVDLAVMIADGGEAIADLAVLCGQRELFGPVASDVTAWRVLDGVGEQALVARLGLTAGEAQRRTDGVGSDAATRVRPACSG